LILNRRVRDNDQFQLAIESRDLTTMRTPLGLVLMFTLPQGGTNSVAHMVNAMNKVLRDCIPDITMPSWTTFRERDVVKVDVCGSYYEERRIEHRLVDV
jgi:hypothetical protein